MVEYRSQGSGYRCSDPAITIVAKAAAPATYRQKISTAYGTTASHRAPAGRLGGYLVAPMRGAAGDELAETCDALRRGRIAARGGLRNDPTALSPIPRDIWDDPAIVLDTAAGDVLINSTPVYVGVMVTAPVSRPSLSKGTARRFLAGASPPSWMPRRGCSLRKEAAEALQRHFSGAPMSSASFRRPRLLRGFKPRRPGQNSGRRRAILIPSKETSSPTPPRWPGRPSKPDR